MNKAVFLDRDGTINEDVNYLTNKKDLVIFPAAKEALSRLKKLGFLNIVITNQSAIARGYMSEDDLHEIHREIDVILQEDGKPLIDEYYYSPYHRDGTVEEYRKESEDRKPGTGLLRKAIEKYDIEPKESFFIGDTEKDMKSAESMGIKGIMVKTGYGTIEHKKCINNGITVDYLAEDIGDASTYIEKLVNIKLI